MLDGGLAGPELSSRPLGPAEQFSQDVGRTERDHYTRDKAGTTLSLYFKKSIIILSVQGSLANI